MRNLKKVLALVIAFSMMLSVVAFAGYNDVAEDADYAGAVELLSALEIFEGDENGNFNPDKAVSRAEMAALICRATGLEEMAEASKGATAFTDVAASHWASGYVNVASSNGIINGIGDGKFAPDATLTYPQAVKMIVYALGFQLMAEDNGGWDAGSVYVANKYKVTEGAAVNATRGNLAILLANAMSTPMMDKTTYGANAEYEVLNGKNDKEYRTLLTNMDIYIATGVVGQKDADEIGFTVKEISDDGEFDKLDKYYEFKIGASAIAAYEDQQVDAYVKKTNRNYEVVAVVPSTLGETLTILSDDIAGPIDMKNGELEYYVDSANSSKTKTIDFVVPEKGQITVKYNKDGGKGNVSLASFYDEEDGAVEDVVLTFVDNTSDGEYDVVIATQYASCRVEFADADNDKLALVDGTIKFDFDAAEDGEVTYVLADENGNALTLADFAEDDVVAYYTNGTFKTATYIEVIKLANAAVTGTIDEAYTSAGKKYVVIDGNEYALTDDTDSLQAGDEGTFYIGITGKVIEYDATLAGENYGYILEGAKAKGSFSDDSWQLKILTKADGIVTYDVTTKDAQKAAIEGYIAKFIDKDAEDKTKFLWDGTDADNTDRLVIFETNSKGEIKEIKGAVSEETFNGKKFEEKEYNADAQTINGASLENDVVVFVVNEEDVEDVYAQDISYLVDESEYTGYAIKNAKDDYAAVVITEADAAFATEVGFAIVTKVSKGKDEEGDTVTKVSYVQNEEEGVLTIADDDYNNDLDIGTVFMYTADANALVTKYIVVADIVDGEFDVKVAITPDADGEGNYAKALGKGVEIVTGHIYNEKAKKNNGKEIIYLDADKNVTMSVLGSTYKYTYNEINAKKIKVVAGDYMDEVEWYDADEKLACPVLFRVVDGKVVDVYTTTFAHKPKIVESEEPEAPEGSEGGEIEE